MKTFIILGDSITDCGRDRDDIDSMGMGYPAVTAAISVGQRAGVDFRMECADPKPGRHSGLRTDQAYPPILSAGTGRAGTAPLGVGQSAHCTVVIGAGLRVGCFAVHSPCKAG